MELNEKEKRVLFQIDGDDRSSILRELNTIADIVPDQEVIFACETLIKKLSGLSDDECRTILMDVQIFYNPRLIYWENRRDKASIKDNMTLAGN